MARMLGGNSGQMLLVVVLTMIVALTVGLSVVSRTVTNLRISRQNDESQRAFQAAEAGVERALQSGDTEFQLNLSNASAYNTVVTVASGSSLFLNGGERVDQAKGIDVWFSNYSEDPDEVFTGKINGTVTFYWSTSNQNTDCQTTSGANVVSALEVVTLTGANAKSPTFNKYILDPCDRIPNTTAEQAGGVISDDTQTVTFNYKTSITFTNGIIAKVIPIFNSTKVAVTSTTPLPAQGSLIESTGESGQTVRKVKYFATHPQVPLEIFPYSILSQ